MRTWIICALSAASLSAAFALGRALPAAPKGAQAVERQVSTAKPSGPPLGAPFVAASTKPRRAAPERQADAEEAFRTLKEGDSPLAAQQSTLQAALRSLLGVGSRLGDVECRGNTCKVTVAHDGRAARDAFMGAISEHPPAGFGAMRLFQSEEGGIAAGSVLFLDRDVTPIAEPEAEAEAKPEPTLDELTGRFAIEPHDEAGESLAARALEAGFASLGTAGTSVEHVECHSTTCKVTVLHGSAADRERFIAGYAEKPPGESSGTRMFPVDAADGARTVLFVARTRGES